MFIGEYSNGLKKGKGLFKWIDNSCYEGDIYNNIIHGKGIYKWSDGKIY